MSKFEYIQYTIHGVYLTIRLFCDIIFGRTIPYEHLQKGCKTILHNVKTQNVRGGHHGKRQQGYKVRGNHLPRMRT